MSKWECGVCNSAFDNYQAQGFNGIIYCPLCYFKELYKREQNNWNELEKDINNQLMMTREFNDYNEGFLDATLRYYNKMKEIKEGKK